MNAVNASINLLGWAVGLFLALVSLLIWRHRRGISARRINRGLRAYAGTHEMVS